MGILGLSKLLGDYAPSAMKENEFKNYFGKILALFPFELNHDRLASSGFWIALNVCNHVCIYRM